MSRTYKDWSYSAVAAQALHRGYVDEEFLNRAYAENQLRAGICRTVVVERVVRSYPTATGLAEEYAERWLKANKGRLKTRSVYGGYGARQTEQVLDCYIRHVGYSQRGACVQGIWTLRSEDLSYDAYSHMVSAVDAKRVFNLPEFQWVPVEYDPSLLAGWDAGRYRGVSVGAVERMFGNGSAWVGTGTRRAGISAYGQARYWGDSLCYSFCETDMVVARIEMTYYVKSYDTADELVSDAPHGGSLFADVDAYAQHTEHLDPMRYRYHDRDWEVESRMRRNGLRSSAERAAVLDELYEMGVTPVAVRGF